jgi:hypothetical protein
VFRQTRAWFTDKVKRNWLARDLDTASNNWVTVPGRPTAPSSWPATSTPVPNGGWLDGCWALSALEILRRFAHVRTGRLR